ncbi:fumarylacetoacetate hydrolase family protein [Chitinophagales bacterium]|nr:fumarylacetoacetate hydrolase family protein [Chitinophagales bacterium]
MNPSQIAAAERLAKAATTKATCEPIRDIIALDQLDLAYEVQAHNINERIKNGAYVVGKKIGLTAKSVQAQLGVDQPDFGILLNDMEIQNGDELSVRELMQAKVEAEIAFVLKSDLRGNKIGTVEVLNAIDYALVSIEVVGSRIRDWDIKIVDTIADNASASHFILGHQPSYLIDLDLLNCKMELEKNGEIVSTGTGAACLGSPINAVVWLARKMSRLGNPLKAGEIILSGALGPMVKVDSGDKIEVRIEGLGAVGVTFTR